MSTLATHRAAAAQASTRQKSQQGVSVNIQCFTSDSVIQSRVARRSGSLGDVFPYGLSTNCRSSGSTEPSSVQNAFNSKKIIKAVEKLCRKAKAADWASSPSKVKKTLQSIIPSCLLCKHGLKQVDSFDSSSATDTAAQGAQQGRHQLTANAAEQKPNHALHGEGHRCTRSMTCLQLDEVVLGPDVAFNTMATQMLTSSPHQVSFLQP